MNVEKEDRDRSDVDFENQERGAAQDEELLDDELETVVGGWNKWETAQQTRQADWVW